MKFPSTIEYKIRWLLYGFLLGLIAFKILPGIFQTSRSTAQHVGNLIGSYVSKTFDEKSNVKNQQFAQYSCWPMFLADATFDLTAWRTHCWTSLPTQELKLYLTKNSTTHSVCKDILAIMNSIYTMTSNVANVQYPETFANKIRQMFNNDKALYAKALEQDLHFVLNKYSFEHTVYNPLRGRRPIQPAEVPVEQYVKEIIEKSSKSCDLCNYVNMTAIDSLGRMENQYAYSAANAFKFDEWHSMFMPKRHDITRLTFEELKYVFILAWQWIRTVHKQSPSHRFPTLLWDNFPHGGASQVHPHIHATVRSNYYYGQFESLRFASERYYRDHNNMTIRHGQKNYFRTIQDIHMALNLTVSLGGVTVLVPLTSRKEFDLIVMAENFDERVVLVIYQILQGYFHKLKQYSFSASLYLPPLSSLSNESGLIPVYFRIVPRGQASSLLSEVSSLDLLSIHNVNKLPADLFAEIVTWFKQ